MLMNLSMQPTAPVTAGDSAMPDVQAAVRLLALIDIVRDPEKYQRTTTDLVNLLEEIEEQKAALETAKGEQAKADAAVAAELDAKRKANTKAEKQLADADADLAKREQALADAQQKLATAEAQFERNAAAAQSAQDEAKAALATREAALDARTRQYADAVRKLQADQDQLGRKLSELQAKEDAVAQRQARAEELQKALSAVIAQ